MDWAKIAGYFILPLVAIGFLADKFNIHIPFTRAGFVLSLASLVVGTLFVIASWRSNLRQSHRFEVTVVYLGLDFWVVGVFLYWWFTS